MSCLCEDENSSTLPVGSTGLTGAAGTNGTNGSSFLMGSGTPSSGTGSNGDTFLDIATYNLYYKSSGAWSLVGNIKGANGTGLIKYAVTAISPVISVGSYAYTITGATLSSYGIPSTSTPGSATPPTGFSYGTVKADLQLRVYEFAASTLKWTQIPDSRVSLVIDGVTGDAVITLTGLTTAVTAIRFVLIG